MKTHNVKLFKVQHVAAARKPALSFEKSLSSLLLVNLLIFSVFPKHGAEVTAQKMHQKNVLCG